MQTKIITVNPDNIDTDKISAAAEIIKSGGLVAFPTETVYGLGANADNPEAVRAIFAAKGRPADNPLIVHVASIEGCERYVEKISPTAQKLMETFWGGPLTLIMPRRKDVPDAVTAGLNTVAVRLPSHPVANLFIRLSGCGIAAPSANVSGRPSGTQASHVLLDFDGRIDAVIDGGNAWYGLESTVVDLTGPVPEILRPGAVTLEELKTVVPDACYGVSSSDAPKSPGMKYKHYAPKAKVFVVKTDMETAIASVSGKVAVIDYETCVPRNENVSFLSCGRDDTDYAARLFCLLRRSDELGVDVVLAADPKESGIGYALRNRLYKSAGNQFITG